MREALVRTRTRYISLMRALVRREGFHVGSGGAETFSRRLLALPLPAHLKAEVEPLLALLQPLDEQIAALNATLQQVAREDGEVALLCTVPQVGLVIASAFVVAVDTPQRFANAHQVQAYFGLVPSERSSGEAQRKGRITKAGNARVRWLLVQAALSLLRLQRAETAHLRTWAARIAARRGRNTAVVALARKLAGILFAMLRDRTAFTPPALPQEVAAA